MSEYKNFFSLNSLAKYFVLKVWVAHYKFLKEKVPLTSFAIASISFGCVRHLQFIYLTKKNLAERTPLPDHTLSRVLSRHISFHLSLLRTKPIAPNPELDHRKWPMVAFIPCL